MSLQGVIAKFKTGDYTVRRRAAGTISNGVHSPGAQTTFSIEASIQPATGKDLQSLPESEHSSDIKLCLTITKLRTRDADGEGDIVQYKGLDYECIKSEHWETWGTEHYRTLIGKINIP